MDGRHPRGKSTAGNTCLDQAALRELSDIVNHLLRLLGDDGIAAVQSGKRADGMQGTTCRLQALASRATRVDPVLAQPLFKLIQSLSVLPQATTRVQQGESLLGAAQASLAALQRLADQ